MIRLIVAALLAAVLQMAWGFVFWMFLPFSKDMVQRLPDEERVATALKESVKESGSYFLPYPDMTQKEGSEEQLRFLDRHRQGPLVQIIYRAEGHDPLSGTVYGMGFAHFFATSFLAGVLLLLAGPGLPSYLARVSFVTLLGVFAVAAINLANPIWFHHPWKFALMHSGFDVGTWFLAALVLGAIVKRPSAS